ncbi:MAG: hypothetical protein GF364_04975 [Candidatus Lokiarchaeota archaeon]|nr:hypothetical protein [Candidatus Lokiarchaeota archaeon]
MSKSELRLDYSSYLLKQDGYLEQKKNLALQNMRSFDILLLYYEKKKRLYIWVGRPIKKSSERSR